MNSQIFGSIDNLRSYDLARATTRKWSDLGSSRASDTGPPVFTTEVLAETSSTAADSFDGGKAKQLSAEGAHKPLLATTAPVVEVVADSLTRHGVAASNREAGNIHARPTVDSLSAETDFHCDKCRGEPLVNGLTCPRCGGKGVEVLI